jgi:hypothetical protein
VRLGQENWTNLFFLKLRTTLHHYPHGLATEIISGHFSNSVVTYQYTVEKLK